VAPWRADSRSGGAKDAYLSLLAAHRGFRGGFWGNPGALARGSCALSAGHLAKVGRSVECTGLSSMAVSVKEAGLESVSAWLAGADGLAYNSRRRESEAEHTESGCNRRTKGGCHEHW